MSNKESTMHGKGEFKKMKGTICNVFIKWVDICYTLTRETDSNILTVVKLKRNLKYRGHEYFVLTQSCAVYQALDYFKIRS